MSVKASASAEPSFYGREMATGISDRNRETKDSLVLTGDRERLPL